MAPTPQDVKEVTEKQEELLKWLIGVFRDRDNPARKYLLLVAILVVFLNPIWFPATLEGVSGWALPDWYTWAWVGILAALFVRAFVVAWKVKPDPRVGPAHPRGPIKGLRPFDAGDAELFRKLQRGRILSECFTAITAEGFRIGILTGESGSGKTSFLQAGLVPALSDDTHVGVYVKLTDRPPTASIRHALAAYVPEVAAGAEEDDLVTLLERAAGAAPGPLVLVLDQFEQFFVHRPREAERAPFIEELKAWYDHALPMPVKVLISIREDFLGRLIEVQRALGYSLGPQEVFQLRKFTPEEATAVLEVIAEAERLEIDVPFMRSVVERELAPNATT